MGALQSELFYYSFLLAVVEHRVNLIIVQNSRVLKNIRNKERTLSLKSITTLREYQLDTSFISLALTEGNVLFSKSNTSLDSCKIYQIEFPKAIESKTILIHLTIENCNKIAIVQEIEIKK